MNWSFKVHNRGKPLGAVIDSINITLWLIHTIMCLYVKTHYPDFDLRQLYPTEGIKVKKLHDKK